MEPKYRYVEIDISNCTIKNVQGVIVPPHLIGVISHKDPEVTDETSVRRLMEKLRCQDDMPMTDGRTHRMRHRVARSISLVMRYVYYASQ